MRLWVQYWGDGPKTALLVHGLSSSAAGWWRLAPALASHGYRITAPDLRGHGNTGPAPSYQLKDYAADLVELPGTWDCVIGHSLGGAAAAIASQQLGWARSMVLLDPALWVADDPEAEADMTRSFRGPPTAAAVMKQNPTWHPEDARIKAEAIQQTSVEVAVATIRQNRPWNVVPIVAGVSIPTLILGADPARDALVPRALGEGLAAMSDLIEYQWVRHASHSLHRDEFDAAWSALSEWLS